MAKVELIMPKMGESVAEATIISWHKEVGETIEMDETIVEIATDKVDSEVPSSLEGKLVEKLFDVDTFDAKNKFFSARRSKSLNHADYGRNISIIMLN